MIQFARKHDMTVVQCEHCLEYSYSAGSSKHCGKMECMVELGAMESPVEHWSDYSKKEIKELLDAWRKLGKDEDAIP